MGAKPDTIELDSIVHLRTEIALLKAEVEHCKQLVNRMANTQLDMLTLLKADTTPRILMPSN